MAFDMALSGRLGREQYPPVYMTGAPRPLEFFGLEYSPHWLAESRAHLLPMAMSLSLSFLGLQFPPLWNDDRHVAQSSVISMGRDCM